MAVRSSRLYGTSVKQVSDLWYVKFYEQGGFDNNASVRDHGRLGACSTMVRLVYSSMIRHRTYCRYHT